MVGAKPHHDLVQVLHLFIFLYLKISRQKRKKE